MVQPALKRIQVASLSGVAFLLMCEKLFSVKKQKPPPGIEMRTCFEYFLTSIYVMCIRRPAAVAAIFSHPAHDIGLFSFNFFVWEKKRTEPALRDENEIGCISKLLQKQFVYFEMPITYTFMDNRVFQNFWGNGNQRFLGTTFAPGRRETLRFAKKLHFLLSPGL